MRKILRTCKGLVNKLRKMIKKRLQELSLALGVSGRKFGLTIGRSESWVRAKSVKIGTDVLVNLSTAWPHVNIGWVLTGIGPMFISDTAFLAAEGRELLDINKDYNLISVLREDNQELRKENKELRETLLGFMKKNEELLIENTQLKIQKESL